ncbi:MAG: hypothetical protein DDG58_13860 [Ardenticatenia bacterium]|nr:MAG: hypothetical protein DDG58_13860 [Ardenticatenia bacterium]
MTLDPGSWMNHFVRHERGRGQCIRRGDRTGWIVILTEWATDDMIGIRYIIQIIMDDRPIAFYEQALCTFAPIAAIRYVVQKYRSMFRCVRLIFIVHDYDEG